ncbi:MAG: hybrid sensor histidine kinase/response regulator, partial [Planctomycetia bacterium]|nr:hybrid sensor histidine kinase/response regulator [Planctomycetia bacterium]
MDKQELAKRLMATYLEELHEHVEAMNRDLLSLEEGLPAERRGEVMKVLFRSAHSLKGASRAVNIEVIENACHMMEDILAESRAGCRELTADLFALFFKVVDAIQEVGMRLRDDQELGDSSLHALIPELQIAAAGEQAGGGPTGKVATPEAPPERHGGDHPGPATLMPEEQRSAALITPSSARSTEAGPVVEKVVLSSTGGSGSVRVAAEKLDALLAQNGELLVARRRIEERSVDATELSESLADLQSEWSEWANPLRKLLADKSDNLVAAALKQKLPRRAIAALERTGERLAKVEKAAERFAVRMVADARVLQHTCDALNDEVYRVRMLPFAEACGGLQRAVRDIAQSTNKDVGLVIQGEDVEVDRSVLEGLKDPLLHLVRNAVDHGIESPVDREIHGKPPRACVTVSAALRGGLVEIVVADDGRGFDLPRIQQQALRRGIAVPQEESEQARLVFLPGFSTASTVTDVSGRGVGLDVVASSVQAWHGTVDVDFQAGVGTRFIITVPLTLTTVRCLLAIAAKQTYAIPTTAVQQLVRFDPEKVVTVAGRDVLLLGGTPTPIAVLAEVLGLGKYQVNPDSSKMLAIVVGTAEQRVTLVVDELCSEQEVLVKNLGARIRFARHVSGATLLPSGSVALVLNAPNVIATALGQSSTHALVGARPKTKVPPRRRLLAVDDSMTTRTLMKSILEGAGYEVIAAVDGAQAWELLANADVDLVVSDVDMPRMDGIELTEKIRGSERLRDIPVILVTARESDEDKTRGIRVGASAYLVKSGFDQSNL